MFNPDHNHLVRYRYESEKKESKFSFLDSKRSEYILKNLEKYQNWQISFSLINWNNDDTHAYVKLYIGKTTQYQIVSGKVIGQIQTKQIRLDFLGIEKIKNDLTGHAKDKKSHGNCRLLVELENLENFENVKIKSHILRNKENTGNADLIIASQGMPKSALDWTTLVITLEKSVPYFPEEIQLRIGETILSTSTKKNSKHRYRAFKFSIPREILNCREPLNCTLECKDFNKSDSFTWLPGNISSRKLKESSVKRNCAQDGILTGPLAKVQKLNGTVKSSSAEDVEADIDGIPNNEQVQPNLLNYDLIPDDSCVPVEGGIDISTEEDNLFDQDMDNYFPIPENEWNDKELSPILNDLSEILELNSDIRRINCQKALKYFSD